jgi:hypothetical protein
MCSGTCTSEKKIFNRETLDFFLSRVWFLILHKKFSSYNSVWIRIRIRTFFRIRIQPKHSDYFGFGSTTLVQRPCGSPPIGFTAALLPRPTSRLLATGEKPTWSGLDGRCHKRVRLPLSTIANCLANLLKTGPKKYFLAVKQIFPKLAEKKVWKHFRQVWGKHNYVIEFFQLLIVL